MTHKIKVLKFINSFKFCFENSPMGCTKPATLVAGFLFQNVSIMFIKK